jgi:membrane protein implicated in regulation of membrane protease activity
MRTINPRNLFIIGFILLFLGLIIPVLMVLQIIKSTLFLNFFAYASSVLGLLLGIVSSAYMVVRSRKKK